ncbi:TetR/AcrR family transcriptional regulator [Nocardia cerradoensis]|uniref:TetR/AcrR family transcriptional regulator n=1 Tax=Nocardia cerradoensis TaxID=85688 RepID=UPI0005850DD6|nr:TetR/AcrR family transcriptional regulator [Nocardia cerradoensis]NKY44327.1 TetR/AcrR family transcriptional regulator [Nocardia cerradoensis]
MSTAAGLGTKGMPAQDRREEILVAAMREFAERGFAAVSMVSIAGRAGISKALVYQHFTSKDQLYAECLTALADPLLERLDDEMSSTTAPFAMPGNALRGLFDTLGPDRTAWRIIHDPTAPASGAVADLVHGYRNRIAAHADSGVRRFLDALGDTDERDIEALAGIWTAAVDAVMAWARAHPEESADDLTTRFTRLIDIVFSIGATR